MEATCNAFVVGVQTYYTPAIVFIGVFCNLLNVLVFTCTRLRSRSSSLYLASLAASDACFLFVLGLSWWSDNFGDAVLKNFGWCQFLLYLSVTSGFFSVWITVAFTTERLVAVRFPLHRSYICTFSRAKIIILVILALSLLCNLYTLFTTGKEDPKQGFVCDMKPQTLQYLKGIFVADLMLSLVIPLVMISIMNTLVVQSLVRSRSQLKFNVTASSSNAETIMIYSNDSSSRNMESIELQDEKPEVSSNVPNHTPDVVQRCISSSKRVQRSVTNMMLLISISFLALSTPR
ncbi:thyrotropin-releasing hormone receptor-like isoform X2 [Cloeon dipterum]|uniref:thyrotropin-releasing hormone receptor-like isoform X2 n=1 Tax=Cloeon dipterum TaxID=197152 RepID=UPI00321F816A